MKACCNKWVIPKINYKASILDSIGLAILLSFVLSFAALIAWALSYWVVSMAFAHVSEKHLWNKLSFASAMFMLFCWYKFISKLIHACSFLVNYRMIISGGCKVCGKQFLLAQYPKNQEPF